MERAERRVLYIREASPHAAAGGGIQGSYTIDGAIDAALLMPTEIFGYLVSTANTSSLRMRQNFREGVNSEWSTEVDKEDFWKFIDFAWAQLRALEDERRELANRASDIALSRAEAVGKQECQLRSSLLREAERNFGREALSTVLYEVVAPQISFTGIVPDDLHAEAKRLAWMEDGCK